MATILFLNSQCSRTLSRFTIRHKHIQFPHHQSLPTYRLFHSQNPLLKSTKKAKRQNTESKPTTNNVSPTSTQPQPTVNNASRLSPSQKAASTQHTPRSDKEPGKSIEEKFPPTLLIYNTGRPRIFAAVAIKMTSIFLCIFGVTWLAPAYYFSEDHPTWAAFALAAGSAIPTLITVYSVPRFVCYVHMVLPRFARMSSSRVQRFADMLPSNTRLDITTLRWLWPRVTRVQAHELYVKKGSALNNLMLRRKVPQEVWDAKKWYHWKPLDSFLVIARSGQVPEKGLWEKVIDKVARGWKDGSDAMVHSSGIPAGVKGSVGRR